MSQKVGGYILATSYEEQMDYRIAKEKEDSETLASGLENIIDRLLLEAGDTSPAVINIGERDLEEEGIRSKIILGGDLTNETKRNVQSIAFREVKRVYNEVGWSNFLIEVSKDKYHALTVQMSK